MRNVRTIALLLMTSTIVLPCFAQTLEETQALDLGTIAILDNTNVGTISVNKDDLVRTTEGVRVIVFGRPAIFQARGFDSNRRLYITVQANQGGTVTDLVSPEQFTVQSYDADEYVTTDDQGDVEFSVGAVFATSGSGSTNFRDTDFSARYSVTVNY